MSTKKPSKIYKCFICKEDITNKIKVYSNFMHAFLKVKDISKYNPMEEEPLCQKCAKKDLEIAHKTATRQLDIFKEGIKNKFIKALEEL